MPVQVHGLTDVTAVATSNTHTCAIANGGRRTAGAPTATAQLGNEGVGGRSLVPVPITGALPAPVATATPTPTVTPQPTATPKPRASISTLAGKRKVSKARKVTRRHRRLPGGRIVHAQRARRPSR